MSASYKTTQDPQEPTISETSGLYMIISQMEEANEEKQNEWIAKPGGSHPDAQPATPPVPLQQEVEIETGHVILHRSPNFFVSTTNRRGKMPNPLSRRTGHAMPLAEVTPQLDKRFVSSDTRPLPSIGPINPIKTSAIRIPIWMEASGVGCGLLAALMAHTFNMINYPRYELDEGTYVSSAWAILNGQITPYPYGYGHPPLGWIQIAAWMQVIGGFFTFGNAINSGRVLMTFFALGCSLLVYLIVRRFMGSRSTALLAMVIFSLSPLSITFQRPVFIDNIAIFWLLLSLYLLIAGNSRLLAIVFAAICFGISLLSKEVFLLFFPVMLYALWLHSTRFQRKFAFVAFTYTLIAIGSSFLLMAVLKSELLPAGLLPWDHHQHLSLFDTFLQQAQRSQSAGSFVDSWNTWLQADILLVVISIAATLCNLISGWWNRKLLLLSLFAISVWALLLRGGVVFPFYIIPLIPFLAMNVAIAINTAANWLAARLHFKLLRAVLMLGMMIAIIPYNLQNSTFLFQQHPTSAPTSALFWVRNHVPHQAVVVINSYMYLDLRLRGGEGVGDGATYPDAQVYWNIAFDPELHHGLLHDDWNRIDYIVADSAMLYDIKTYGGQMQIIAEALQHSVLRAEFRADDHQYQTIISIYQVIHNQASP